MYSKDVGNFLEINVTHNFGHIHRSVSYLKPGVSETQFCLRFELKPTQVASIKEASLSTGVADDGQSPETR
jgi:hypothetical protein